MRTKSNLTTQQQYKSLNKNWAANWNSRETSEIHAIIEITAYSVRHFCFHQFCTLAGFINTRCNKQRQFRVSQSGLLNLIIYYCIIYLETTNKQRYRIFSIIWRWRLARRYPKPISTFVHYARFWRVLQCNRHCTQISSNFSFQSLTPVDFTIHILFKCYIHCRYLNHQNN